MEDIGRVVVIQSFLYSISFLTVALSIAVILDLFKIQSLHEDLKKYVYRTFFVGILALMIVVVKQILIPPTSLQSTIDKAVAETTDQNIKLATARAQVVQPTSTQTASQLQPEGSEAPTAQTPLNAVTLYIQTATTAQKSGAGKFVTEAGKLGVKVPGIEIVGARAPTQAEVRYFNPLDKTAAEKLAALAAANGSADAIAKSVKGYASKPGVLEFWYQAAD